jgi:hypothetical protein
MRPMTSGSSSLDLWVVEVAKLPEPERSLATSATINPTFLPGQGTSPDYSQISTGGRTLL